MFLATFNQTPMSKTNLHAGSVSPGRPHQAGGTKPCRRGRAARGPEAGVDGRVLRWEASQLGRLHFAVHNTKPRYGWVERPRLLRIVAKVVQQLKNVFSETCSWSLRHSTKAGPLFVDISRFRRMRVWSDRQFRVCRHRRNRGQA